MAISPGLSKAFRTAALVGALGMGVGLALSFFWRLITFDYLTISNEARDALSSLSFFLCPSSFVLMEVGPRERITFQIALLYGEVIILNGLLYGTLTFIVLTIVRLSHRTRKPQEL